MPALTVDRMTRSRRGTEGYERRPDFPARDYGRSAAAATGLPDYGRSSGRPDRRDSATGATCWRGGSNKTLPARVLELHSSLW